VGRSFIHPQKGIIRGGEFSNQPLRLGKSLVDAIELEKTLLVSPTIRKARLY